MAQTTQSELPDWLLDISKYYGGRAMFKLEVPYWLQAYPDLLELIDRSQKEGQIIAIPVAGDMYYNDGVPQTFNVEILANTWRRLREANRERSRRQTTVDGKEYDLRNGKNHEVAISAIEDLAVNVECWIRNLSDPNPKKRNGSERFLQTTLSLRGRDLERSRPDLYRRIRDALTFPISRGG